MAGSCFGRGAADEAEPARGRQAFQACWISPATPFLAQLVTPVAVSSLWKSNTMYSGYSVCVRENQMLHGVDAYLQRCRRILDMIRV
jgi:hypothetical protein